MMNINNINNINLVYNVIDKDGDYHPCIIDGDGKFFDIFYDKDEITGLLREEIIKKGYRIEKETNLDKIEKDNIVYKRKQYLIKAKEELSYYLNSILFSNDITNKKFIENLDSSFIYRKFEDEVDFIITIGYKDSFGSSFQVIKEDEKFYYQLGSVTLFEKENNEEENKKNMLILLGVILQDQEEFESQLLELETKYLLPMSDLDK